MTATETREVTFQWWLPGVMLRCWIGDDIHFNDVFIEEMQALIDELQWKDGDPDYQLPAATHPRSQPGNAIHAFADWVGPDEEHLELFWDIYSGNICFSITESEAQELVRKWEEFLQTGPKKINWEHEGF